MRTKVTFLLLSIMVSIGALAADEVPSAGATKAVQVIGLAGIKSNTKGTLEVKDRTLLFSSETESFNISAASIEDVITRNDTQRAIRGTVGTLSQLAPYGAGRALSLFREQIDTLTIEYRDSNGALHGAVFTMAIGQAEPIKKELLAQGAQTTVASGQDSTESSRISEAQEVRK